MAALTQEQVAQILVQAGWTPADDPVTMLAIGGRESKYDPAAHRTDNPNPAAQTGDFGLFQLNSAHFEFFRQNLGITQMSDLLDPVMNAKAALLLKRKSGFSPWAASSGGFNAAGSPTYGTNRAAAQTAWDNATNQGLLGQNWGGSVGTTSSTTTSPPVTTPTSTFKLPSDARIVNVAGTWDVYALFTVGGANVFYKIPASGGVDISGRPVEHMDPAAWAALGGVDDGSAEKLVGVDTSFGTYQSFFDHVLTTVMGANNPARTDPDVLKVILQKVGRPDMTDKELQNLLASTPYWQQHTDLERVWNDLSPAEQATRRSEKAVEMVKTWADFTGQQLDVTDPRIANYVDGILTGKMGAGAWTETVVKRAALDVPNSPWARNISDEQKAEKQPGIDVENTALRVRQTLQKWGVQWGESTIQDWARKIVNKDASDDDLINQMKDQAQAQYGQWKPRDMETATYAAPWVETYNRVMETQGDLSTPQVQAALTQGKPVWEFEQNLKKSDGWLNTKNARDQLTTQIASVGKLMGY